MQLTVKTMLFFCSGSLCIVDFQLFEIDAVYSAKVDTVLKAQCIRSSDLTPSFALTKRERKGQRGKVEFFSSYHLTFH